MLSGNFVVMIDGKIQTFGAYEDVPNSFEHIIKAEFDYPEGPHTDEQHEWLDNLGYYFNNLKERETK